jgi:hypothetical protein
VSVRWPILFLGTIVVAVGCEQIQEPWVQNPDQLRAERTLSEQTAAALRERLAITQSDR